MKLPKTGWERWRGKVFRSIARSIAIYGCFILTLSEFLRFRTSGRCGRAQCAELFTSVSDLLGLQGGPRVVKLFGVDSSKINQRKSIGRTRTMFSDNRSSWSGSGNTSSRGVKECASTMSSVNCGEPYQVIWTPKIHCRRSSALWTGYHIVGQFTIPHNTKQC